MTLENFVPTFDTNELEDFLGYTGKATRSYEEGFVEDEDLDDFLGDTDDSPKQNEYEQNEGDEDENESDDEDDKRPEVQDSDECEEEIITAEDTSTSTSTSCDSFEVQVVPEIEEKAEIVTDTTNDNNEEDLDSWLSADSSKAKDETDIDNTVQENTDGAEDSDKPAYEILEDEEPF